MDNDNLLSALNAIDPADLTYTEWIEIGMALKDEGFPCSVWDEWSRKDPSRYHSGECDHKWGTFKGEGSHVKGGTIVQWAQERGWAPERSDRHDDKAAAWNPARNLITYIDTLFVPEDIVGYVTNDVYYDKKDGKWKPLKGVYDHTAGELVADLKKHPDDIAAVVGKWNPEAGAWIRINPLDGNGTSDKNVVKYRYVLVESDDMPISEQKKIYQQLELPIAALVNSGKRSLHAIVHIDARDDQEYKKRVSFLFNYLKEFGLTVDEANKNPSRLSRMPGVTRGKQRQYLVATDIGKHSWAEWESQYRFKESAQLVKHLEELDAANNYPTNDLGNARLFAAMFADECRYSVTYSEWAKYDGIKWSKDQDGMYAQSRGKALADAVLIYATYGPIDDNKKKDYLKYAFSLSSSRIRNAVVRDARDINVFSGEELDLDDYLFNVLNGTLDLREDPPVLREHNPDDLLSKVANVEYDPDAKCELWQKSLSEIFENDTEKIRYVQKVLGLCLSGDTSQEEMYFFYGSTSRNGKSTICNTVLDILGDYGQEISPETLALKTNKDSRTASPDLAKLAGARFVVVPELPKRMMADASLLKTVTGRDRITARYLHENEFSFIPKFKMIFNTNSLPSINDQTVFLSDRIRVIEFNRHFDDAEQDKHLKDKLKTEAAGILNWMIEGYQLYRHEGLGLPESIKTATQEYADDSDKLGKFIDECLIATPGQNCKGSDVYQLYEQWTKDNGYGTESKSNFFSDLKAKGMFKKSGKVHGVSYKNIVPGYVIQEDGFMRVGEDDGLPFE